MLGCSLRKSGHAENQGLQGFSRSCVVLPSCFAEVKAMLQTYTAKYTKIDAGYMGQLVEWPEVITEGKDLEEAAACCKMLPRKWYWAIVSETGNFPQAIV